MAGRVSRAAAVIAEAEAVTEATETRIAPYGAMLLAAFRGRASEAVPLIEAAATAATAGGQGIGVQYAAWAGAILDNGLGRYEKAFTAAEPASEESPALFLSAWALPELVEACARSGRTERGADALDAADQGRDGGRLRLGAGHRGPITGAAQHRRPRRHSLSGGHRSVGPHPDPPGAGPGPVALRRVAAPRGTPDPGPGAAARGDESFVGIGIEAFADRARRELLATGEKVRKRTVEAPDDLTAQEQQIAALARDGLSNPEIGARLFISPRTVEWHLRKVFDKLPSSRAPRRASAPAWSPGYRRRGWAVVASARTIKPSEDPDVLTVDGDIADPATADRVVGGALRTVRPHRHPRQQRGRLHLQAVHRLHRR